MAYLDSGGVTTLTGLYDQRYKKSNTAESATNLSGIVPVTSGGTGRDELTSNAVITGNGENSVNMVGTQSGALFATSNGGIASFGTLPIEQGGTNATTAAGAAANIITGSASTIASSKITASRALITNSNKNVAVSTTTSTELGYLSGATSNIQTQLDGKMSKTAKRVTDVKIVTDVHTIIGNHTTTYTESVASEVLEGTGDYEAVIPLMGAATSEDDGTSGLVPKPPAGTTTTNSGKYLNANGEWSVPTISGLTASRALVSDTSGNIAASTISSTKLGYLTDVTGNIQAQLNAKQATITGSASTIANAELDADKVLITNSNKKVAVSSVTSAELDYLSGATSNIQTQINNLATAMTGVATYKGAATSQSFITNNSSIKAGWYWVVSVGGTYFDDTCEVGDMIFCNTDTTGASATNANFDIIQSNITAMTSTDIRDAVAAANT